MSLKPVLNLFQCLFLSISLTSLRRVLALILIVFTLQSHAAKRVFIVSQEIGSPEIVTGDAVESANFATDIQGVLNKLSGGSVAASYLLVDSLDQLPEMIRQQMKVGDTASAIVFIGHGNPTTYVLAGNARYSGAQLANYTFNAFKNVATDPKLLVYLSACSCGVEQNSRTSLQTDFLNEMQRRNEKDLKWQEIHTLAHQDYFGQDKRAITQRYTNMHDVFYRSGKAAQYYQFDVRLREMYGPPSDEHRTAIKNLLLNVAITVDPTQILKNREKLSLAQLVQSVGPVSSVMEIRDRLRFSLVNIKSTNAQGEISNSPSTIYTAFQNLLYPGYVSCKSIFSN